jgi:hypothetical protein
MLKKRKNVMKEQIHGHFHGWNITKPFEYVNNLMQV